MSAKIMPLYFLLIAALLSVAVAAQDVPEAKQTRIDISKTANSELRLQVNGSEIQIPTASSATRAGIKLSRKGNSFEIQTGTLPSVVDAATLGAWSLEIPGLSSATLQADLSQKSFRFAAPLSNRLPLLLTLPDKGSAEMRPESSAELEVFDDGAYIFHSSTNVVATTADGQKLNLSRIQPPVLGGELRQVIDPRGNRRFQRANPAIQIDFSGTLDSTLQVKTPEAELTLDPEQEKQLTFKNGSRIFLTHSPSRQLLEWRVEKGAFNFKVAGFTCWKSTAISGQSGRLQFNPIRKIIDFSNASSSPIYVQLSGRIHASVGAGATFQYAQFQDCGSFTTSATGGEVVLYDRDMEETTPVLTGVTYSEGERVGAIGSQIPWNPIMFGWVSETRIEFRTPSGLISLEPGQEETLFVGRDEFQLLHSETGEISVRAITGNFEIRPAFIPDVTLNMPEGSALLMNRDRKRQLFTARAAESSAGSTRVVADGQTYISLSGLTKLSVVIGQNTFIPETAAAWIFFEGAGGDSAFKSTLQPAPIIRPDRFDASRIFQQPVSVLK